MSFVLVAATLMTQAAAEPQRPALPVENGAVQIVQRVDASGGFDCVATALSAAMRVYGDATCARFRAVSRGPMTGAAVTEITMVIGIAEPGGAALPEPVGRGRLSVDQEAEMTVAADGSVGECRALRNVANPPVPAQPPMCERLRQDGPGAFSLAPNVAARQARVRTSVFLWRAPGSAG